MAKDGPLKAAKEVLEGVEEAQRVEAVLAGRKCDWDNPDDVRAYRREMRVARRMERLKRIGFQCPKCEMVVVEQSKWVITRKRTICRRCFSHRRIRMTGKWKGETLIVEPVMYCVIDMFVFAAMRESCGLGLRQAADMLDVSVPTLLRWERVPPYRQVVLAGVAAALLDKFRERGLKTAENAPVLGGLNDVRRAEKLGG
jgi:DNA-binding transcriptional regulator YiaG